MPYPRRHDFFPQKNAVSSWKDNGDPNDTVFILNSPKSSVSFCADYDNDPDDMENAFFDEELDPYMIRSKLSSLTNKFV